MRYSHYNRTCFTLGHVREDFRFGGNFPVASRSRCRGQGQCLDPETVLLDMVKGAELAVSKGFHLFSVTVARPDDAVTLRKIYGDGVQVQAEAMRPHARAVAGLAGRRLGYTCMGRYKPHG